MCAAAASAQERKDLQVFRDISDQVNRYTQFTIFDNVDSVGHSRAASCSTGWVTMPFKKDDIERRVRSVDGVDSVDNSIEVLPVSQFDDELRFRIARAIYGNSAFWNYAAMANPPIHIVVNRRPRHADRRGAEQRRAQLARSLATGFGAFEVKNELKTDDEVQAELERIGQ